jgi:hypothetical protein
MRQQCARSAFAAIFIGTITLKFTSNFTPDFTPNLTPSLTPTFNSACIFTLTVSYSLLHLGNQSAAETLSQLHGLQLINLGRLTI